MAFSLDPRLEQDTVILGDFPLCRLLLTKDVNYPWFVLVPRRDAISEIFQLEAGEQQQFYAETTTVAQALNGCFKADKINVAALGNVVAQLHMHVIVRYRTDAAWPAPVWGKLPATPYADEQLTALRQRIQGIFGSDFKAAGV